MDEAEQLCDRLVVMDGGAISAEGSPAELIERYATREVVELRFAEDALRPVPAALNGAVRRVENLPDRMLLYASDGEAALRAVHAQGVRPRASLVRRATLEDVFLRLTGRRLVD
jgi:lipooligosaccharide transport system ATP-binding protein